MVLRALHILGFDIGKRLSSFASSIAAFEADRGVIHYLKDALHPYHPERRSNAFLTTDTLTTV